MRFFIAENNTHYAINVEELRMELKSHWQVHMKANMLITSKNCKTWNEITDIKITSKCLT